MASGERKRMGLPEVERLDLSTTPRLLRHMLSADPPGMEHYDPDFHEHTRSLTPDMRRLLGWIYYVRRWKLSRCLQQDESGWRFCIGLPDHRVTKIERFARMRG